MIRLNTLQKLKNGSTVKPFLIENGMVHCFTNNRNTIVVPITDFAPELQTPKLGNVVVMPIEEKVVPIMEGKVVPIEEGRNEDVVFEQKDSSDGDVIVEAAKEDEPSNTQPSSIWDEKGDDYI